MSLNKWPLLNLTLGTGKMKTLISKNSKILWSLLKWKSKVTQSCLTPCDPMDHSLPSFSVHEIFKARVLEWVASSFSRGSSWPRDRTQVSHTVGRCFTLCTTFPGGSDDKEFACNSGDLGSIPGLERSPGEVNDYPVQYSRLENPMERRAWRATVHGSERVRYDWEDSCKGWH